VKSETNCIISSAKHMTLKPFEALTFESLAVSVCTSNFKIPKFYKLPTLYLSVRMYIRTKCAFCPTPYSMVGVHNRSAQCLLRGTNWLFN